MPKSYIYCTHHIPHVRYSCKTNMQTHCILPPQNENLSLIYSRTRMVTWMEFRLIKRWQYLFALCAMLKINLIYRWRSTALVTARQYKSSFWSNKKGHPRRWHIIYPWALNKSKQRARVVWRSSIFKTVDIFKEQGWAQVYLQNSTVALLHYFCCIWAKRRVLPHIDPIHIAISFN